MSKSGSSRILKSSTAVAFATLLSRLLGFVREILIARYLGGASLASAWQLAFMIPNSFRRILGEGALGTALVPLLSHSLENDGRDLARRKLAVVVAFSGALLALICIFTALLSIFLYPYVYTERVRLTFRLIPLLIPYAFFICLVGVAMSALNSLKVFFLPALGALLLNISMIACLVFVCPRYMLEPERMLYSLSYAVLIAGCLQLLLMLFLLHRQEMLPLMRISNLKGAKVLGELWHLTLPGVIGASALQISLFADRILACWLGPRAVPALTYSDRVVYLPIGVFAVSFGAVSLSMMSSHAAKDRTDELLSSMNLALRHLLFICVPTAVFLLVFREPVIRGLFLRGRFGEEELKAVSWAMLFYSIGIPAFASLKVSMSGFYSRKDMITPLKVSVFCVCLNIVLNLILMWPLQQGGIALATVISSVCNNVLLIYLFRKTAGSFPVGSVINILLRSALVSIIAVFAASYVYSALGGADVVRGFPAGLWPFFASGLLFCIVYFIGACLFMRAELSEIASAFLRRGRK